MVEFPLQRGARGEAGDELTELNSCSMASSSFPHLALCANYRIIPR
jgi:hypothetical protein